MRVLTALFILALALLLAWFSAANWMPVTLKLWPPYELVIRLPVLMVLCVLAGWLPSAVLHSISRWRWRRRLVRTEQALETSRVIPAELVVPASPEVAPTPTVQPTIVPPAGA